MVKALVILIFVVIAIMYFKFMLPVTNSNTELPQTDIELWVMIETDAKFLSQSEIDLEMEVIDLIEGLGLGEADGHSSGANQFDFNFINVQDFEKSKQLIRKYLEKNYPDLKYEISKGYEATFDSVN
jgi:flagellar biosynthesis/type III secretory pathway M-ring protein FliF/YscJ